MSAWQWIILAGIVAATVVGYRFAVAWERSFEDSTVTNETGSAHEHRASCHGPIGELQCGDRE